MKKIFLFFGLISLILTFILFNNQKQIAGGEESFSIFNSSDIISLDGVWGDVGTGFPNPTYLSRIPLSLVVRTLYIVGIPYWLSQSFIFFLIFLVGMISMFYLTKHFFRKADPMVYFFSALFYLFNLYSQSQIFGRFLYAGIFLWALIPTSLFFWLSWIEKGKIKYLVLFLVISLFFSNAFLQPANILTFWVPIGILTLSKVLFAYGNNRNGFLKIIIAAFIGFFAWLSSNLWWIYPFFKLGGSSFSEVSSWQANFDSLRGVSQYFPTSELLLLRQGFLFGKESGWFSWYGQSWIWGLTVLILVIVIIGWRVSRSNKNWISLTALAFVGWFISKGSNQPAGFEFYRWLFSTFPFTAVLRNPYEKFGIVWLLPYSVFFALGVNWIYGRLQIKIRKVVIGSILVLSCGVLVWPMWNGDIYKNARVKVPDYYKQANDFLNQDKSSGRILILPIIPGDGVRYSWGYQGVEPSEFLFDKSAISKILRTKYADDKYWQLYNSFISDEGYEKILNEMNVRYLILHGDLIPEISGASSSAQVRQILEKNKNITFINRYGQLEVYKYNGNEKGEPFAIEGEKPETISYREVNNRRYIVSIKNAKSPYSLIFKETFNDLWQARIDGMVVRDHFLVYDYANGWKINKFGDYEIEIVFKVWPWD